MCARRARSTGTRAPPGAVAAAPSAPGRRSTRRLRVALPRVPFEDLNVVAFSNYVLGFGFVKSDLTLQGATSLAGRRAPGRPGSRRRARRAGDRRALPRRRGMAHRQQPHGTAAPVSGLRTGAAARSAGSSRRAPRAARVLVIAPLARPRATRVRRRGAAAPAGVGRRARRRRPRVGSERQAARSAPPAPSTRRPALRRARAGPAAGDPSFAPPRRSPRSARCCEAAARKASSQGRCRRSPRAPSHLRPRARCSPRVVMPVGLPVSWLPGAPAVVTGAGAGRGTSAPRRAPTPRPLCGRAGRARWRRTWRRRGSASPSSRPAPPGSASWPRPGGRDGAAGASCGSGAYVRRAADARRRRAGSRHSERGRRTSGRGRGSPPWPWPATWGCRAGSVVRAGDTPAPARARDAGD